MLEADECKTLPVLSPLPFALPVQLQGAPGSFEGPAAISWNSSTVATYMRVTEEGKVVIFKLQLGL